MEEQFEKAEFFDTPEQLAEAQAQEAPQTEAQEPIQTEQPVQQEAVQEQPRDDQGQYASNNEEVNQAQPEQYTQDYSDQDVEKEVFSYLSERLNREISSFEDLSAVEQEAREIDERVLAISEFVDKTGRSPEEWFNYQSLDTSEMDDLTAVKVDMASKYPNLSNDEIDLLLGDKYKTNPEIYDDEQVRLAQLQLKIDAQQSKSAIEEIRNKYSAPTRNEEYQSDEITTTEWINEMTEKTSTMQGVEFDLGNGKTFTFGLNEDYKNNLISKNTNLEDFFDPYIDQQGEWDHDTFNTHRAVIDNIQSIVGSAYKQGLGDGQRGLVNKVANVSSQSPQQSGQTQPNPLADQVANILEQQKNKMSFGNF